MPLVDFELFSTDLLEHAVAPVGRWQCHLPEPGRRASRPPTHRAAAHRGNHC